MRRRVITSALALGTVVLFTQAGGRAQTSSDALLYSNGFLVTGDYIVSSVDLPKSGGTGTIHFVGGNTVPDDADIVAAYLYWETITSAPNGVSGATFRGTAIQSAKVSTLSPLPGSGAKCWGSAGGGDSTLVMVRADVLPLLPKRLDANGQWTGKYIVNDSELLSQNPPLPLHTVTLPQQGTGNVLTQSAGASLLLVYRDVSSPLRKVVIYDGVYAQAQGTKMQQTIRAFYRSAVTKSAKLTHLVGSGAGNTGDRLLFNGTATTNVVATNPIPDPIDGSADRGWASPTYDVSSWMPGTVSNDDRYGETVTTTIDHGIKDKAATPYECLAWAAVIFSTAAADIDGDGIPDGVEDASGGLKDPPTQGYANGQELPNLNAMGASSGHKDLFVEINAMWAQPGTSYGSATAPYNSSADPPVLSVIDGVGHNHLPKPAVLKIVGDAYWGHQIHTHFDVGNTEAYFGRQGYDYVCPDDQPDCISKYLVPSTQARGGEAVEEVACTGNSTVDCRFPDYPGTVGWRLGLQLYKDAPVGINGEELTAEEISTWLDDEVHRRRFDRVREQFFHYLFYVHARGKSKSAFPCRDADNNPADYNTVPPAPNDCVGDSTHDPLYAVPQSVSGIADLPGNTAMISLGLWDDFVGSEFVQGSTTLHELGHNLNLWHGGDVPNWGDQFTATYVQPNCKPNYLSSMSYLFQVHGLFDDNGHIYADYSNHAYGALDELSALPDAAFLPQPSYQPAWYVPWESPLAAALGASKATRFCNGPKWDSAPVPIMARVRALSTSEWIDWNGDGDQNTSDFEQDVNFDDMRTGVWPQGTGLAGFDDWSNVRLDQIGASRKMRIVSNAGGDFLDFGTGDFTDFGTGDWADFGTGDFLDFGTGTYYVHFASGNFGGDFLDFGTGDWSDFGTGDFADFGTGVFLALSSGDFQDFGTGDWLDFGTGDWADFGTGDWSDFGTGDWADFGTGDFLDFGTGDSIGFGTDNFTLLSEELDCLDYEQVEEMGPTAPYGLTACIIGQDENCTSADPLQKNRIRLTWKTPTVGTVDHYEVHRVAGATVAADSTIANLGTTTDTTFVDMESLTYGQPYTYFVKAIFVGVTNGVASNFVTIIAPDTTAPTLNFPPVGTEWFSSASDGTAVAVDYVVTVSDNAGGSLTLTCTPASGTSGDTWFIVGQTTTVSCTVTDLAGNSASGSFDLFVQHDDAPVAADDSYATPAGMPLSITSELGVLHNDSGDSTGSVLVAGPAHAAAFTLNSDGSFTYTPASSFVGVDTFTYQAIDVHGFTSNVATVTIAVRYRFINVQNLPPPKARTFNRGSTVPLSWQWADAAGVPLDTSMVTPGIKAWVCSTSTPPPLPGALIGVFTPENPGLGNSFQLPTAANNYTWKFNWKLQYFDAGQYYNLPAGSYVVRVYATIGGTELQADPTDKVCQTPELYGAPIVVK